MFSVFKKSQWQEFTQKAFSFNNKTTSKPEESKNDSPKQPSVDPQSVTTANSDSTASKPVNKAKYRTKSNRNFP
jgi:hypothetical protein